MTKKTIFRKSLAAALAGSLLALLHPLALHASGKPQEHVSFEPFVWPSEPPASSPFEVSKTITGIRFTGTAVYYGGPDTWYPSWATDGHLYSPMTDGNLNGWRMASCRAENSNTAAAKIIGEDPRDLELWPISLHTSSSEPYIGRYPSASLVLDGVWYYGTYCVDLMPTEEFPFLMRSGFGFPIMAAKSDPSLGPTETLNINYLGPFVGFRTSTDMGRTWTETPHTPSNPLFPDPNIPFTPTKIGAPHFVDFGQNMEHSPDGKAYLVAHGSIDSDPSPKAANASWITGDAVYLIRVKPSIETINDASQYEYFCGNGLTGEEKWTSDFSQIKPLFEWNNHAGCVTVTYNHKLEKHIMSVSYGLHTNTNFNTYILESDKLTGPWRLVAYMKDFGEQAYFVNFPTKFISEDGRTAWMMYSANYGPDKDKRAKNPPGSGYGLSMQEVEFLVK